MKCEEFIEILPLYVDKKYSEINNIDGFEAHAGSCEKCSEIFAEVFVLHEGLKNCKDKVIHKTPELKEMLSNIGELKAEGITGEDFLKAFDQEREQYKDSRAANLKKQAKNLLAQDRPEEAKKCLNEALELRPGDTEIVERLLLFSEVIFDDTPQKPKLNVGNIMIPIMKPTGIVVEYPGDEVWRYDVRNKEIFASVRAISALQDRPEQPVSFETDSLIIEIHKGEDAGKLVIRLKK